MWLFLIKEKWWGLSEQGRINLLDGLFLTMFILIIILFVIVIALGYRVIKNEKK